MPGEYTGLVSKEDIDAIRQQVVDAARIPFDLSDEPGSVAETVRRKLRDDGRVRTPEERRERQRLIDDGVRVKKEMKLLLKTKPADRHWESPVDKEDAEKSAEEDAAAVLKKLLADKERAQRVQERSDLRKVLGLLLRFTREQKDAVEAMVLSDGGYDDLLTIMQYVEEMGATHQITPDPQDIVQAPLRRRRPPTKSRPNQFMEAVSRL